MAIAILTANAQKISIVEICSNAWIIEVTAERFDTLTIESVLGENCLYGFKKSNTYTFICNGGTEYFAIPTSNHITITVGNVWRHFHYDIKHIDPNDNSIVSPKYEIFLFDKGHPHHIALYYEVTENANTIQHCFNASWRVSSVSFDFLANTLMYNGKPSSKTFRRL